MNYSFSYSKYIVDLIRKIEKALNQIELNPNQKNLEVQLRKKNQIQTITGSCQIEGNTLTQEFVTDILSGKKIRGSDREILEVKNAYNIYDNIEKYNCDSKADFLKAHHKLMDSLDQNAGKLRKVNVGVGGSKGIKYIAPLYDEVPNLISNLFLKLKNPEFDDITISTLVHLEIESIHPFVDGNGRIGRFWQTLYLTKKVNPIFQYMNIEGLIKENQDKYYEYLIKSQSNKNSNYFVEFMLQLILESLKIYVKNQESIQNKTSRLLSVKTNFKKKYFSRLDYMNVIGLTSTATATRDLKEGFEQGILEKSGDRNQSKYRFK